MKKIGTFFIFFLPLFLCAQGIKWTEGLTWQQIKQKAKQENKYIFLDCYATWCIPCKKMDKEVYSSDSVGQYFNDRFISVKVQMDKSKNDNEYIRSWYGDVDTLSKIYKIEGVPSFVFLSPDGNIVHEDMGYQSVSQFVRSGQIAVEPGKKHVDPYIKYYQLVTKYHEGIKQYELMPYMIKTAQKLGDTANWKKWVEEHYNYISTSKPEEKYTVENIDLWSGKNYVGSATKRFIFFYEESKKIDQVKRKDFSRDIIDKTIQYEMVTPFWESQQYQPQKTGKNLDSEYVDPNWQELYKRIKKKYTKDYAERNVLNTKIGWYYLSNKMDQYVKFLGEKFEFKQNDSIPKSEAGSINFFCFNGFLKCTQKKQLQLLASLMRKLVQQYPYSAYIDTYAALLYKLGRKQEAIQWEEKALSIETVEIFRDTYIKVIAQMKAGDPIHGAVWDGIIIPKEK